MQAIQGTYNHGVLTLQKEAPKTLAKVIVIFTEEPLEDDMPTEEALRIVKKYSGRIKGGMDAKEERQAYLDERYGSAN